VDFYNYSVDLPFTKNKIIFRELNTQEQLFLAKANFTHSNDKESMYDYFLFVKKIIENCVEDKNILNRINIVEYVLFLVKLRIVSIGSSMEFFLNNKSPTKTKVQIDLKNYLISLYKASDFLEKEENNLIFYKNIKVKLNWPMVQSLENFSKMVLENKSQYEIFNESVQEYIESIEIKNNKILCGNFDFKQKNNLIDSLNLKVKNQIQDKIIEGLKILFEAEVFDVGDFKNQKFNFYNFSFIEHIKLFFSYDVRSIYQEIYLLASCNLNPEYVLSVSPSERNVYLKIFQQQRKSQEKSSSGVDFATQNGNISNDVKNLAAEFGDVPPP
jgi:hypothetical protein